MTISIHTRENSPTSAGPPGGVHGDESASVCCATDSISVSNQDLPICGDAITSESVETCDDGPKLAASESSAGETKGVIPGAEKPHGKKRMGKRGVAARPRNRAAEKAMREIRHELGLPNIGKHAESIRKQTAAFRRVQESSVINARGEISLSDACAIATACTAQRHSLLAAMWLRKDDGKLTASEKLALAKAILEGSEKRDKAVASLRLPGGQTDHAAGGGIEDAYARVAAKIAEQRATVEQPAPVVQAMAEQPPVQAEESTSAAAPFEQLDGPAPPAPPPAAADTPAATIAQLVPMEDL